jgi:anti-sigma-K factor RskA
MAMVEEGAPIGPDDRIVLAAELALGVLDGAERAAAMRLVLEDPAFARTVEAWRTHFATMFAEWRDAIPSAGVEAQIMRAIEASQTAALTTLSPQAAAPTGSRWAWATGVATLIAACLVLALALRPQRIVTLPAPVPAAAPAPLVAAITPTADGGDAKPFAAMYNPRTGEVRMAGRLAVPAGRNAELWVIEGDGPPHALGVMAPNTSSVSIGGANLKRMTPGVTLAVSIEPAGGSPTGLPTGPVVATGTLAAA